MGSKYVVVFGICITLIFLISGCSTAPEILPQEKVIYDMAVESIEKAEMEIKLAEKEEADEVMPKEYNRARGYLATATAKLNDKKFLDAKELAEKANNEAKLSRELPRDARNSVSSAILIVSSAKDSELAKLFSELVNSAEKDLQDAKKYLEKNEFAMAKNYANKVVNELGTKKDKFAKAKKAIDEADKEINAAKEADAHKFVSDEFNKAENSLKAAKTSLSNKDFDNAKRDAESSQHLARDAKNKVPDAKKNLEETVKNEINEAKNTLEKAKQDGASEYASELLNIAESSISNADSLLNQKNLVEAKEASKKAKLDAESVLNKTNEEIGRIKAEEEAKKKAEEEAKIKAVEEKRKAEEEAKIKAEEEAKKKTNKKPIKKKTIKK